MADAISAAFDLSYAASDLPDRKTYMACVAAYLRHVICGDLVGWNSIDVHRGHADGWLDLAQNFDVPKVVAESLSRNPMIASYVRRPRDLSPRRMSDCITFRALKATRFYSELFVPLGARDQLSITSARFSPTSGFAWAINRDGSDFGDRDVECAVALQPMLAILEAAYQLREVVPHDPQVRDEARERCGLTVRELDVLELIASGLSARQIAGLRRIAVKTVRKHLQNVYAKLDCHDRVLAVNAARLRGLL